MTERAPMGMAKTLWHTQRVKGLVRERLGQGAACIVSVRETICTDPSCPGPATLVRITDLSFREKLLTIHKPVSKVGYPDIAEVI
ncbi:hypothetical protein [Sulfitobacter donghicola]|uniref:Uncharacterized protein n=1 Tax=Sulfitobacter donghicola DSW-25 = KCTC 12864 = JCM 14565 TaxID=1300350 RepID=A0A073IDU7_9RHOB|nr:hypothetical protein [Sulfitobacter donghicola]KEJ87755.1 hypothetical protein DSW25_05245 [Sulfitobacter donghicola DSW-25 = KCTC 12864 = JCM 14565]KIN66522.1 hypothetical protein Z948_220 [Sulfitobacter donghicola DSW-25 = KCTC 12864 = JCM 14565]